MRKQAGGTLARAVLLLLLLAADQLSKWAAVEYLKGGPPFQLIGGVLELVYTENTGAAFGLFKNGNTLLIVTGLLLAAVLCWLYFRLPADKKWNRMRTTGVVLIAGAIGNLIDRFVHGFVVDFIYFVPINFPKFNLADSYLTLSLIVLFCLGIWGYTDEEWKEIRLLPGRKQPGEKAED